jgi:hypothetical protein
MFLYGVKDPILILDEFDVLIDEHPYMVNNGTLNGIWQLRDKKVIAFSATSSVAHERLVNSIIGRPLTLKFKSEYELVHGVTPIQDASIKSCGSTEAVIKQLQDDIIRYYDKKPIIVICDNDLLEQITGAL